MIACSHLSRRWFLGISFAVPLLDAMQDSSPHGFSALLEGTNMIRIPPGEFLMGSQGGNPDEEPVHRVRIGHGFEMSKFEVTQAQWDGVMKDPHGKAGAGANPSYFHGASLPVENVSWEDVQQFLERLNGRDRSHVYRLPTEAEWEYACRAGTTKDRVENLSQTAWYKQNAGDRTQPVGQKEPNAWGLHDMLGNVAEWVQDWYGPNYYEGGLKVDPRGPATGSYRVFRGGCWFDDVKSCRAAYRGFDFPGSQFYSVGFRLVRTARGSG